MIIDLTSLNSGLNDELNIHENITIPQEYIKESELIDINNVIIDGTIFKDSLDNYNLNLQIEGTMILPCSRTLKPTEHKFKADIEENIEENEEKTKKIKKTIDILPIIWENILMEIPIRIINPEAENKNIKGEGWELITDSEN